MFDENRLQQASVEELRLGYVYEDHSGKFVCFFCGAEYRKGIIYQRENMMTDAELAMKYHIRETHGSSFAFLAGLDKQYNGLSSVQKELLSLLYEGLPDAKIAAHMKIAESTVRNHRFLLRKKYKEAKIFMAIMEELFGKRNRPEEEFVRFHAALPVNDDRVKITEKEKSEIIGTYFDGDQLKSFPKKQKKKLALLQHISEMFDPAKRYSEREVNSILKNVYEDYVTIRRYMIDYGFLDRKNDGTEYWVMSETV